MQLHNFSALKLKIRTNPDNRCSYKYIFAHRNVRPRVNLSKPLQFLRIEYTKENQSDTIVRHFLGLLYIA